MVDADQVCGYRKPSNAVDEGRCRWRSRAAQLAEEKTLGMASNPVPAGWTKTLTGSGLCAAMVDRLTGRRQHHRDQRRFLPVGAHQDPADGQLKFPPGFAGMPWSHQPVVSGGKVRRCPSTSLATALLLLFWAYAVLRSNTRASWRSQ